MRYFRRIGSLGFYIWYSRHEFTHVLIGLVYAWFLREVWQELSPGYVLLSAVGSVLIDADHVLYYFLYGRKEWYAIKVRKFIRQGQIRTLWIFLKNNHKYNTGLAAHNVYFVALFFIMAIVSLQFDWKAGVVIFGATVLHLMFDVVDDLWVFGSVNDNWKRLKRKRNKADRLRFFPDTISVERELHSTSPPVKVLK